MKKIGLALSGGGFRATLYHLGLCRFLHDAGILPNVSHITSVSGGSVFAAHLALNWNRYNGSGGEFEAAAAELISFIRLDVRNRILRRFPLSFPLRGPRRLLGQSNRKLTRTGLLEYHYERHLYGDTSLFQLPEEPRLHVLATNVSEGYLCAFDRNGLLNLRRQAERVVQIERIHTGLATVAMAVTASSAFPGFFPPFELTGADVGVSGGGFGRQSYTDGGIFDNLGVRVFRCLEQSEAEGLCGLSGVLVSDVGKRIQVQGNRRTGGFIRTALRASEILMDRVWQLENETFTGTPGFIFARISDLVEPQEDPTALHPETQRQVANIRTDFDRFSWLEISSLIRHGYCVGRKTCRLHPEVFGTDIPGNAPWDPAPAPLGAAPALSAAPDPKRRRQAAPVTLQARTLQASANRRIWSTLLDYRDWTSYIFVPIIIPLLVLLPYMVMKYYERSHRINQIVESLAQGSRDLGTMTQLLEGPVQPWVGESPEEAASFDKRDFTGFAILQDSRILDLRNWVPPTAGKSDSGSFVYGQRRSKVVKQPENTANNVFRIGLLVTSSKSQIRFPPQQLRPRLRLHKPVSSARGEAQADWEADVDFQKVPADEPVDLIYEHLSPGDFLHQGDASTTLVFGVEADTGELTSWILIPKGKEYRAFRLIRYPTGKPANVENIHFVTEYLADDFTILAFKLLALKSGYTYELTWFYR